MAEQIPYIKVFISSPGDVNDERKIALEVIEQLPYRPSFRDKVTFRVIAWDKPGAGTPMRATLTPQDAINQGLPMPGQCDIVIVLFWSRMGTPFEYKGQKYQSGTHFELLDALDDPLPETVIYRRIADPQLKLSDPRYDDKVAQYRKVEAFFKSDLFYESDGTIKRGINQYTSPEEFRKSFETDLEVLVLDILKNPLSTDSGTGESEPDDNENVTTIAPVEWDSTKSPFPGLRSFTEDDAPIFFGRGRETDALVQQVKDSRFVAVVGASGSGKSSLVGAGLMPRLRGNAIIGSKDWHIVRFTPGNKVYLSLFDALIKQLPGLNLIDLMQAPETVLSQIEKALSNQAEHVEVLLFIDQFEELFTLNTVDDANSFAKLLSDIARSECVRAIVTMRHDFYYKAIENQTLSELFRGTSFSLSIPKRDALREMIERPAERAQLTIEVTLIDRILDDTGDEPGNLALMAYALDELYKLDDDKHLTHAEYAALGGVQGAIGTRAENQFKALNLDDSVIQQVFHALVEVDERGTATRQRANLNNFNDEARQLIDAFVDARLLVASALAGENDNQATIEVAHEAILRQWERLANWIEATQDDYRTINRMKREARIWNDKGKPEHLRPNAETLQEFQEASARLGVKIDDVLLAEFAEPEQERLYHELKKISTSHQRRYDIGERLARIGDYRDGIGVKDGLPDIAWSPVRGSSGNYSFEFGNFDVPDFFIGKYLITTIQLQTFLDSDWENPLWWRGFPERYQPQDFSKVTNGNKNAPRDTISWYQSIAFGRWLNHKLLGRELRYPSWRILHIGEDAQVRLPTEWEWQWAAMNGVEKREYPWGKWDEHPRANTTEAGIANRSTAVGMYPHGKAQCGALDMSGNLYEWCANNHGEPERIDASDNGRKVVRGGSFGINLNLASCASRPNYYPYSINSIFGFRLVVAPTIPR